MGTLRKRNYSSASGSDASDHFISINERPVDDISLEFFYKPHTVSLLIVVIIGLIYAAFTRDESNYGSNIQSGVIAAVFFFIIISILAFPNGPFTRPHPAVWRTVFGLSVLYLLLLIFIIFQDYKTVKGLLTWIFPDLKNFTIDMDKGEWGEKCDDLSLERLYMSFDFFCFAHFAGWVMKTLLVRHYGILWTISVMWEITEIAFSHLLPNFVECWWDALILDVLICNGLGIWVGMQLCHYMEMRFFNWESIKNIHTTTGKLKRAALQFTPESWTAMRWLDPACSYMRFLAVCQLVIFWQVSELNTFLIKHIFEMPPSHPFVFMRIFLIGAMSATSIRQYYTYVTDPRCKRVGTHCWVYGLSMITESLICIKFGSAVFQKIQLKNIILWLIVQLAGSTLCVYLCVVFYRRSRKKSSKYSTEEMNYYINSNLNANIGEKKSPKKFVTLQQGYGKMPLNIKDSESEDESRGVLDESFDSLDRSYDLNDLDYKCNRQSNRFRRRRVI